MGTFIALEGAEDSSKDELLKASVASGQPCDLINLRTLRRLPPGGDAGKFVLSRVAVGEICLQLLDSPSQELINKLSKDKTALLILDKFDVWAPIKPSKDDLGVENHIEDSVSFKESIVSRQTGQGNSHVHSSPWSKLKDSIIPQRNIEEKVAKTRLSWVYRILYLLRYSVAYRLHDDGYHFVCVAIHANAASTRPFFSDIFHHTYEKLDLREIGGFLNNTGLPQRVVSRGKGLKDLADISRYLNAEDSKGEGYAVQLNPLYQDNKVAIKHDMLQLQIPFNVKCNKLTLPKVTLICGEQGSGKTTLLNAIIKAWLQGEPAYIVCKSTVETEALAQSHDTTELREKTEQGGTIREHLEIREETFSKVQNVRVEQIQKKRSAYKLEFYNILSQYVGCGESFVRHTFQKARNNKPALVVIDDVELLFQEDTSYSGQGFSTLSRTLINEVHALEEGDGVIFVACTSGNVTPKQLPTALTSIPNTTIVLTRYRHTL